jgi:hypothetical protein
MTARYDHSDFDKIVLVVKERNKKVAGATDRADAPSVSALRIFTGE